MRVLLIGDVVGRPGCRAVSELLPALRQELSVSFVVANGENSAGGNGLTPATFSALIAAGVDVVTTGNHGMTGPHLSCLGMEPGPILARFRTGVPVRYTVASEDVRLQGLLVEIDEERGLARSATAVERRLA